MCDIFIRFLSCFILNRTKRRNFRKKHMLKYKFEALQDEVKALSNYMHSYMSISKVVPATGALRAVQLLSLDVFKQIDKVCKKNHIKYWVDFGTLLGAVRHKGFVPWDDDIDISMESKDFEKFCKIAEKELKGTKCVFRKAPCNIAKILHIEFVPETDADLLDFYTWRLRKKLVFTVDIFPYYTSNKDREQISKIISSARKDKEDIMLKANSFDDLNVAQSIVKKANNSLATKDGENLFLGLETGFSKPCVYKRTDIFPLKTLVFEGIKVPVPNKPNKVLSYLYGDYWVPPRYSSSHVYLQEIDEDQIDKLEKYIKY